jgi:hypothetical protein
MSRDRARAFQQLEFRDPRPFLVQLRAIAARVAGSDLSPKAKALRTNALKWSKELREGAIFCYGMAQRIGQTVYLAPSEAQDYDFVASWVVEDTQHLAPVQLKEVVPQQVKAGASVQERVNALTKYVDSEDLTVAIYLNQRVHFDPAHLVVPQLNIAALWVFGAISPDKEKWGLWGNFLETPEGTTFEYPT